MFYRYWLNYRIAVALSLGNRVDYSAGARGGSRIIRACGSAGRGCSRACYRTTGKET